MCTVESLRGFVNERLSAAAEEIFRAFKRAIVDYEEEILQQRKLLDVALKPQIKLHRIELPQHHVVKEEQFLSEQLLCVREEVQLGLKQETDAFMLTPTNEGSPHSEDHTQGLVPDKSLHGPENQFVVKMPVIISVTSERNQTPQLLANDSHLAESKDQGGGERGDSGSTQNLELKPKKRNGGNKSPTKKVDNATTSRTQCDANTVDELLKHDIHGDTFNLSFDAITHSKNGMGKKRYCCETCLKSYDHRGCFKVHMRTHTGEKPFLCLTCGKRFIDQSGLMSHTRMHTGEKPYTCTTCGKDFRHKCNAKAHMRRAHAAERTFLCKICGKSFFDDPGLTRHMRTHTDAKDHVCTTCGRAFRENFSLKLHMRMHTGDERLLCKTCGKSFTTGASLDRHMKIHIGKKPLVQHAGELSFTKPV